MVRPSPPKTASPLDSRDQPSGSIQRPLIVELRSATADLHAAVERLPVMVALMAPAVTRADYRRYLLLMAKVYGALEPPIYSVLESELAAHPELRPRLRPKLPALLADLVAQGIEPPRPAASLDPAATLELADLGMAVGGLYVLEGASLGARVIAKHLRRRLREDAAELLEGGAFLGLQASGAGSASTDWKDLVAQLEHLAASGLIEPMQAIHGARTLFERVHLILGAGEPPK